ncbi:hypothetical protein Asppvi_004432 [Aspergillus pseudoviridinutans]|uniref:Uncharacterized protein n=1 Tax=Aspergillus pseudoviridinutans TaxID=1517512 RepID=A0A9P3BAC3_9EURO|nr:uncharacterized protein Asppvi_004432 [Aspergillus pseudoviridinutans]GIJ85573.1 hypothetical protein Asppvi_004432 [Aspergillus pseudoviridinutans]
MQDKGGDTGVQQVGHGEVRSCRTPGWEKEIGGVDDRGFEAGLEVEVLGDGERQVRRGGEEGKNADEDEGYHFTQLCQIID